LEAGLKHPIFDPVRAWLDRSDGSPSLAQLNSFSEEAGLRSESGRPIRFVPPAASDPYYEIQVYETGRVQTRAGNRHDLFNALAWLAFPKTKARINALHAAEIAREREQCGGRRGRLRDMLTIFDEGGAIVACRDAVLVDLLLAGRWRELFWEHRAHVVEALRVAVLGHAVLEQALAPYPGITCKLMLADPGRDLDAQAAVRITGLASPKELPPLPVFGYPGWLAASDTPAFYADSRYFRPRMLAAAR
jgi:Protein of unknown function (DUF3025)